MWEKTSIGHLLQMCAGVGKAGGTDANNLIRFGKKLRNKVCAFCFVMTR